jgi:hypothetical protein
MKQLSVISYQLSVSAPGFVVSHPFHDRTVKWMGHLVGGISARDQVLLSDWGLG